MNAPKIMFGLPGHEQVEKKGDEITFTSGAYYATDLKWFKKTSAGDTPISSEEYTVYYQEYDDGTPFCQDGKSLLDQSFVLRIRFAILTLPLLL